MTFITGLQLLVYHYTACLVTILIDQFILTGLRMQHQVTVWGPKIYRNLCDLKL